MKRQTFAFLAASLAFVLAAEAADPLRVFIRAGEATHAPGAHEYPQFLKEWTALLEARGCIVDGALAFPTGKQLANTDVLILHSKEAGNINIGTERKNLETFIKRGGGLVVIHGGAVSRTDPDYYKSVIGGSWRFGTTKWLEAPMSLYFTDRENPITRDVSNFDIEDEIYYDMDLRDNIHVLAAAYTPKAIDTGGKGNKEAQARAAEAVAQRKAVNIYDIQPQMWTYERTAEGGREPYRAFVHIPGHWHKNFSHIAVRTMLLRGIAWAGKRDDVDEFCKVEELGDALRYVEGGVPRPDKLPEYLEVHPDFELSLVASEPLINNPMNINWDEKGRLWVVETPEYPNGLRESNLAAWMDSGSVVRGQYDRDPLDRISILTDSDGDGVMDKKHVFADKLELVTSSVFYKNGVIACSAPDIWYFQDTDGDDIADKRTKLYTNLGTRDTHAVINNMRWGRDGYIYATHGYSSTDNVTSGDGSRSFGNIGSGVVRFKPDGSAFEQYASKGGNTWGLETTVDGEVFFTQPTTGNPLVHVALPEYILAKGKLPGVTGTNGLLEGEATFPAMHWEQQAYVQIDQVGRYTAGAGCVIYQGGAWPEKWNRSYFTTEPTLNIVGHFFTQPDGVTYTATKEAGREETEFIRSTNLWFRPIDVRTGPDGALYVTDFCNQAIIHNDTRGPVHGPANAAVRPDRDHYYGRIWRVQHKNAKELAALNLDRSDAGGLEKATASPNKHTRETAWRLLRENHGVEGQLVGSAAVQAYEKASTLYAAPDILDLVGKAQDDWTLSALIAASSHRSSEVLQAALASKPNPNLLAFTAALAPRALWNEDGTNNATRLLAACAKADPASALVVEKVLAGLAGPGAKVPPFTPGLKKSLASLLNDPATSTFSLPLVATWDKQGTMADATRALTKKLVATIGDKNQSEGDRAAAARSLVRFHASNEAILPAIEKVVTTKEPLPLQRDLIAALGSVDGPKIGDILIGRFTDFEPALQNAAFDQIVKRPGWTGRLLGLIEREEFDPTALGPANIARLRNHPVKGVAKRADTILARFNPINPKRAELIASLTPEIIKPGGDPAAGKILYATCFSCHKLGDTGIAVGPALDGMGAHPPEELLVQILDPNREVEPSFWAYNITTKKGESFTGVITSENEATISLATQVGPVEIPKGQITRRENTKRSLMPEGLESLGTKGLRDLLAYLKAEASTPPAVTGDKGKGKGKAKRPGPPPPLPPTPVKWEKGKTSVLLIGGGSAHDFKRFFGDTDTATLEAAGFTTHYTEDRAQATELLAKADVAVVSVNRAFFDTPAYRKAFMDRLASGKGVIMLHPGTWYGYKEWPELNAEVVGGGSRGHDKLGPYSVEVLVKEHPIMAGVSPRFDVVDELYYMNAEGKPEGTTAINVLARTSPSQKYGKPHPSVWTTAHPVAKVVGIALGHDESVHDHKDYQKILANAVGWIGSKKKSRKSAPPHALNLDEQGWDPDTTFPQLSPEEAIKTIEVPKGYHLEVVASEPMVEEPVSFAFGPDGALYVCEWRTYMQDEHATGQMDPVSRVVKLVDTDGDGVMDKRTVFIDKALLPRTVLVLEDRVLVNFTDTESIWAYFDDDGDGVSDRHELAYEGKSNKGNIEHQASGLVFNLDNRIDGNYARYRYDSQTGKITATPHSVGRISQWGLARDDDGRLYCSWAGGGNPAHSFQFPAGYPIVRVNEHAEGYNIPYASCKVWDQSSGDYNEEKQTILEKFSATGGQSVLRSPLYPEWYGNVVTPEPVGRFLRMSRIEEDDKTGLRVAHNQFPESEFIRSTDAYFRPVWSDIGPDGCLYIADMYRGIIQEKSWFPTDYDDPRTGWVNRYHRIKKWGMLEAYRNGRIYRLVPNDKNRKPGDVPDMTGKSGPVLAAQLGHPNGWWRDTAQKLIVTGNKRDAIPALKEIAHDPVSPLARINARWTLEGLEALSPDLIHSGLEDKHPRVRATAIRLAENNPKFHKQLAAMTDDPDPNVAIQLYLSLNDQPARAGLEKSHPGNPLIAAIHRRQREAAAAKTLSREAQRGLVIYDSLCITCHGPDGRGVREGAKLLAPNLAESKWFKQGRIDIIARILLKGQFGPIDGITYGEGIMVPLELAYDDRQLADVINYVGETWHNWPKKRFTLEHVGRIRGEITDRTTPWTEAELRAIE